MLVRINVVAEAGHPAPLAIDVKDALMRDGRFTDRYGVHFHVGVDEEFSGDVADAMAAARKLFAPAEAEPPTTLPSELGLPIEVREWLAEGGYFDVESWMRDSDYVQRHDGDGFLWEDHEGQPIEPTAQIMAAYEARNDPPTVTCRLCGHPIVFRDGCWQDADGYACRAVPVGDDRHVPAS